MKFAVFFALLLLTSFPALAQTPVPKETANAYFENCIKTASPTQEMSAEGQQMLCACTAARLTQFFTMEDWKAMGGSDPAVARPAYNKMMTNIYAPCMAEPVRERYYNRCLKVQGQQQQLCTCTADKLASYMQYHGSRIFGEMLAKDPNMQDPWAALENYGEFNGYIDMAGKECLK